MFERATRIVVREHENRGSILIPAANEYSYQLLLRAEPSNVAPGGSRRAQGTGERRSHFMGYLSESDQQSPAIPQWHEAQLGERSLQIFHGISPRTCRLCVGDTGQLTGESDAKGELWHTHSLTDMHTGKAIPLSTGLRPFLGRYIVSTFCLLESDAEI
jgi:hypothetical protein